MKLQEPSERITWEQFEHRCQKPEHRLVGNWVARRVTRPAALRITWLVIPWGISAHAATLAAWACLAAASLCFAQGTPLWWLIGAALWQLWYLLDHVDGQLARWHGTASLDGVALDYLMHHSVPLLVAWGCGWGLAQARDNPRWLLCGLLWSLGWLAIGLLNDVRYKAFFQRLKRVDGQLEVRGGNRAAEIAPATSRRPWRFLARMIRKSCETHIVMNLLNGYAVCAVLLPDSALSGGAAGLAFFTLASWMVTANDIFRGLRTQRTEQEFACWFTVPAGQELHFEEGRFVVRQGTSPTCESPSTRPTINSFGTPDACDQRRLS